MRHTGLPALLILVSACTSPPRELSAATDTERLDSNSTGSSRPYTDPGKPLQDPASAQDATAPKGSPPFTLEASVPLVTWNAGERRYELRLVDPATGQGVADREPIEIKKGSTYAPTIIVSADGTRLAAVTGVGSACEAFAGFSAGACWPSADAIRLIDVRTWREVVTDFSAHFSPSHSPFKGWASPLVFSQDNRRFAVAHHDREGTSVLVFDAETGRLINQQALAIRPRLMEFTLDGSQLVIYGSPLAEDPGISQPDPPSALLLDASTLEVQWKTLLPGILDGTWCLGNCETENIQEGGDARFVYWSPAVVFDAELGRLHIVHADEDRLTTVDFLGHSVRTLAIGRAPTLIERLLALTAEVAEAKYWPEGGVKSAVLSRDGSILYVVGQTMALSKNSNGQWQATETPLGLHVVDVNSGHELTFRETDSSWIRISADRRHLILAAAFDDPTELLEAETLDQVGRVEGWNVQAGRRLDGRPVVLLASWTGESPTAPTRFSMLELEPFEVVTPWSASGEAFWAASP